MPVDALPVPLPTPAPGAVTHHREYRDALGRGLTGTVTFTGTQRSVDGHTVVVPAPVTVPIVNGVIDVDLPPDTYSVSAQLRTVDGARLTDTDTVVIG